MLKKILDILLKKVPLVVILLAMFGTAVIVKWLNPKPSMSLVPIQVNGIERIIDKQPKDVSKEMQDYIKYVNRYLYLQTLDLKNIYTICYGRDITDFDDVLKKLEK